MNILARITLGLSVLLQGLHAVDQSRQIKPVKHAMEHRYSNLTLQLSVLLFSITLLAVLVSHFMALRTPPSSDTIPLHVTTHYNRVSRVKEFARQSSDAILGGMAGVTKRFSRLSSVDNNETNEEDGGRELSKSLL